MQMTNRPVVLGVFTEQPQAEAAARELGQAGFSEDQIQFSLPGSSDSRGWLKNLDLSDDEFDYYKREYDLGRAIVAVRTNDRQQEAADILKRNGGYDINSRQGQTSSTQTGHSTDETAYTIGQTGYSSGQTVTPTGPTDTTDRTGYSSDQMAEPNDSDLRPQGTTGPG